MSDPVTTVPRTEQEQAPAIAPAGCRFSLYPMTDEFVSVILDALAEARRDGLHVDTDDVSTYVSGEPEAMLGFVAQAVIAASRRTGHVTCVLLLSRGCPGEAPCRPDASPPGSPWRPGIRRLEPTGVRAAAHFSLYPLGSADYMEIIDAEIERTKAAGLYSRAEHFASRLDGDLADVLSAIGDSWARADVHHAVAHATISVGSPTRRQP